MCIEKVMKLIRAKINNKKVIMCEKNINIFTFRFDSMKCERELIQIIIKIPVMCLPTESHNVLYNMPGWWQFKWKHYNIIALSHYFEINDVFYQLYNAHTRM